MSSSRARAYKSWRDAGGYRRRISNIFASINSSRECVTTPGKLTELLASGGGHRLNSSGDHSRDNPPRPSRRGNGALAYNNIAPPQHAARAAFGEAGHRGSLKSIRECSSAL